MPTLNVEGTRPISSSTEASGRYRSGSALNEFQNPPMADERFSVCYRVAYLLCSEVLGDGAGQ